MIKNKGITELNAFVQYGIPPKQLKVVIRNLRNKGMSIAETELYGYDVSFREI